MKKRAPYWNLVVMLGKSNGAIFRIKYFALGCISFEFRKCLSNPSIWSQLLWIVQQLHSDVIWNENWSIPWSPSGGRSSMSRIIMNEILKLNPAIYFTKMTVSKTFNVVSSGEHSYPKGSLNKPRFAQACVQWRKSNSQWSSSGIERNFCSPPEHIWRAPWLSFGAHLDFHLARTLTFIWEAKKTNKSITQAKNEE